MERTSVWAIVSVMFCTFLTSSGQLLWKVGVDALQLTIIGLVTNIPLISGLALYGIGAIILLISLRHGELSVLYPFLSLSYVWVPLLSVRFLDESINLLNWSGVVLILVGVSLIGKGASYE